MSVTIGRISGLGRVRSPDVREVAARVWESLAGTPEKMRRLKKRAAIGIPLALVAAAGGWWLAFGPMLRPDYEKGNIRRVFTYTLLSDEFNKLPVEERLELVGTLIRRVKSMGAGDSALVAAFAAGIAGAAREQLEENASRLAIDTWDMYAKRYMDIPPEGREAFLDMVVVEFSKLGEALSGETSEDSDTERLTEAREQAKRDVDMMQSGRGPSSRFIARAFRIMNEDVGGHASGGQRARGAMMMLHMTRRLRGQPLSGPGGG